MHKALMAETDSLFLTRAQVAALRGQIRCSPRGCAASIAPLGEFLARGDGAAGKAELDSASNDAEGVLADLLGAARDRGLDRHAGAEGAVPDAATDGRYAEEGARAQPVAVRPPGEDGATARCDGEGADWLTERRWPAAGRETLTTRSRDACVPSVAG